MLLQGLIGRLLGLSHASVGPWEVGCAVKETETLIEEVEEIVINNGAPESFSSSAIAAATLFIRHTIIPYDSSCQVAQQAGEGLTSHLAPSTRVDYPQARSLDLAMSDDEDDFMSDKFLVEASSTSKMPSAYSERRAAQQLKSMRTGQAKNQLTHKQEEAVRRREGLNTSLFDEYRTTQSKQGESSKAGESTKVTSGGAKAMAMMQKMGWSVGEGLGRKRSLSPLEASKRPRVEDGDDEAPRGGLGSKAASVVSTTEPLRISMWAGRKGLSSRPPSPPPLPKQRNPDAITPQQEARLARETEGYREWQRKEYGQRDIERKEWSAREKLVQFDRDKGVKVGLVMAER